MVSTSRSTSAASLRDQVSSTSTSVQACARVDAHELGVPELHCTSASRRSRVVDQRRQLVDPVLADAGQQRQAHAHANRPRDLEHRARHPIGRCAGRLDGCCRPRRDGQPEARAEDGQVAGERLEAGVGPPAGRQPEAGGADRHAQHGRSAARRPLRSSRPPTHGAARDGRGQRGERQRRLIRSGIQHAVDEDRAADDGGRQRVAGQQAHRVGRREAAVREESRVDQRRRAAAAPAARRPAG